MDIKPPRRPGQGRPTQPLRPTRPTAPKVELAPVEPLPPFDMQPIETAPTDPVQSSKRWSRRKKIIFFVIIDTIVLIVGLFIAGLIWYQTQLSPVGDNQNEKVKIVITQGSTPDAIGDQLEAEKLIRSSLAFSIYTRLSGTQNLLQAGSYRLSPAESTPEIVEHLTSGNVDTFDITFLPGATLKQNRRVLLDAGYSQAEVDSALAKTYDSPLFAGKPSSADLEGYIYGDTYRFGSGASVEEILGHTFEEFFRVIEENDLKAKFESHGLSLYEGITLASIVQREAVGGDEAQIAGVFYNRMAIGMTLGSDVTYQYIADKTGVPRDPNLDSPYNTRRYTGLPPGPIATPGLAALQGVASPAESDYLFFLSGDDDVTYFARTDVEHEQNIIDHCQQKCQIL